MTVVYVVMEDDYSDGKYFKNHKAVFATTTPSRAEWKLKQFRDADDEDHVYYIVEQEIE